VWPADNDVNVGSAKAEIVDPGQKSFFARKRDGFDRDRKVEAMEVDIWIKHFNVKR